MQHFSHHNEICKQIYKVRTMEFGPQITKVTNCSQSGKQTEYSSRAQLTRIWQHKYFIYIKPGTRMIWFLVDKSIKNVLDEILALRAVVCTASKKDLVIAMPFLHLQTKFRRSYVLALFINFNVVWAILSIMGKLNVILRSE